MCVCKVSACVPSCPSPSSVSRSKRLAFELLWKWSMPYGQSRCGLTWFGFNTSPQEVHKASRSSFVMLVIFLRGPVEPFAFLPLSLAFILQTTEQFHTPSEVSATADSVSSNKVDRVVIFCFEFCIINLYPTFYFNHYPADIVLWHTHGCHIHILSVGNSNRYHPSKVLSNHIWPHV